MKSYYHFILVLMIALSLTIASAAHCEDCEKTLHLCDVAFKADEALIHNMQQQIDTQNSYISGLNKQINKDENILPGWAWFAIGIATGAAVVGIVK